MHLDIIWALIVFETRSMHEALALLFGLIVLGAWAAILIARKRDTEDAPRSHPVVERTETSQERHEQVEQHTLEMLLSAVESGRASLDPQMGLAPEPLESAEAVQNAPVVPAEQPPQANGRETQKERRRASRFVAVDAEGLPEQSPWWVANSRRPSAERSQTVATNASGARPAASGGDAGAKETTETVEKKGAPHRLPRLTELRGTMFSTGIKELDHARNGAEAGVDIERLKGPLPSLEALLQRARERNAVDPQAAQVNALLAAPRGETSPVPASEAGTGGVAAVAELKQQVSNSAKGPKRKLDKDAREPYDKVEILPSQRGQYKRKGR